jgi:hypothetical protein
MALTTSERERVRYHLGYPEVQPAASIQYGMPAPVQTAFLVEFAMSNILPEAEDRVRRICGVMDTVESQLLSAQMRLAALALDELKLRPDEPDKLEREYVRWGCRLADMLGVPIYAYSTRYMGKVGGVSGGTIPVR